MTEEVFKVGDVVKHRASGEKGIVTYVFTRCCNPEHSQLIHATRAFSGKIAMADSDPKPTGEYKVSHRFDKSCVVNGFLLELDNKP